MKTSICFGLLAAAIAGVSCTGERGELKVNATIRSLEPVGSESGELDVARARIAVSEIELEGGKEDEREASMGEAVISIALDGQPTTIAVDSVEAGTYHTLGIELAHGSGDFERDGKTSILVEGTVNGNAFEYRSAIRPEVEFRLDPEVDVPARGSASVGISFDVAAWFRGPSDQLLDPTDAANQEAIESRILASMAAVAEIESEGSDND